MKLAFVWKWWSGKTTLAALFIHHLREKHKKVIAIDADINVWLADNLSIKIDDERFLSKATHTRKIRQKLIWENQCIDSASHFVKTTPPGKGSYIIDFQKQDFFDAFSSYQDEYLKFFHVGTYRKEEIWVSCYHTHLSVLENMISHTFLRADEFLIADMVAGNDSFSNTLHSQFDVIFLIIEPTIESLNMVQWFMNLANHSKETSQILIIGNKIEESDDLEFIKNHGIDLDFYISYNKNFKKYRREWKVIWEDEVKNIFDALLEYLNQNIKIDSNKKLRDLHRLHKKYINLDYIKTPLWDLNKQIDLDFHFDIC